MKFKKIHKQDEKFNKELETLKIQTNKNSGAEEYNE